jgi:hypothetical protein
VDRGEVAGRDHHVRVRRAIDELSRLVEVAMEVAEGEDPHPRECASARAAAAFRGTARRGLRGGT